MSNAYIGHGMRDEIHLMMVGKRNNVQDSLYAIQKVERGRHILDGNMGEGSKVSACIGKSP